MFNYVKAYLGNLIKNEKGQGMVEYALIIALVAILLVGALTIFKDDIAAVFTKIGDTLNPTTGS